MLSFNSSSAIRCYQLLLAVSFGAVAAAAPVVPEYENADHTYENFLRSPSRSASVRYPPLTSMSRQPDHFFPVHSLLPGYGINDEHWELSEDRTTLFNRHTRDRLGPTAPPTSAHRPGSYSFTHQNLVRQQQSSTSYNSSVPPITGNDQSTPNQNYGHDSKSDKPVPSMVPPTLKSSYGRRQQSYDSHNNQFTAGRGSHPLQSAWPTIPCTLPGEGSSSSLAQPSWPQQISRQSQGTNNPQSCPSNSQYNSFPPVHPLRNFKPHHPLCALCKLGLDTDEEINQHVQDENHLAIVEHRHRLKEQSFDCPFCSQTIPSREFIKGHVNAKHPEVKPLTMIV